MSIRFRRMRCSVYRYNCIAYIYRSMLKFLQSCIKYAVQQKIIILEYKTIEKLLGLFIYLIRRHIPLAVNSLSAYRSWELMSINHVDSDWQRSRGGGGQTCDRCVLECSRGHRYRGGNPEYIHCGNLDVDVFKISNP